MKWGPAILILTLWPVSGGADELALLFPPDRTVCYARDYDAAHLARHPGQRVTAMRVVRRATPRTRRNEAEELASAKHLTGVAFARIAIRLRETKSRLWSGYFSCTASRDGRMRCSSGECDGGAMMIQAAPGGGLRVYLDPASDSDAQHFTVVGCDSAPNGQSISLSIKTDSTPFLLKRASLAQCRRVGLEE